MNWGNIKLLQLQIQSITVMNNSIIIGKWRFMYNVILFRWLGFVTMKMLDLKFETELTQRWKFSRYNFSFCRLHHFSISKKKEILKNNEFSHVKSYFAQQLIPLLSVNLFEPNFISKYFEETAKTPSLEVFFVKKLEHR